MLLSCGHMPILKDLVVKQNDASIEAVQLMCKEEGDFRSVSILECFKQTGKMEYVYEFFHHCGHSVEQADQMIHHILPNSFFCGHK